MAKTNWIFEKSKNTPLEIYQELIQKDKKNENRWKVISYISAGCFVLSLFVMIYAINLPRTVPVLITMSDWGEAKYVGEINRMNYQGLKVPEVAIEYQIRTFVTNMFSIPGDPDVLKNNLLQCYSCLTRESAAKLSKELKENNPLQNFGSERRTVEIESVLLTAKNSYQVDFVVTSTNKDQSRKINNRYRGVITTALLEPAKDDQIKNPLGIYIKSYNFTEIKN